MLSNKKEELHIYLHGFEAVVKTIFGYDAKLEEIQKSLSLIINKLKHMAQELDALKASVAKNTDVIESAILLIQGIKAKLDAAIAAGDPAALQELSDSLGAEDQKLADAIVANTPSE